MPRAPRLSTLRLSIRPRSSSRSSSGGARSRTGGRSCRARRRRPGGARPRRRGRARTARRRRTGSTGLAQVRGSRSGRRGCGRRRERDALGDEGEHVRVVGEHDRGLALGDAGERGARRSGGACAGRRGRRRGTPARGVDGDRVVLEHGDARRPRARATARAPKRLQSWLPSTATTPSGARSAREQRGDPVGRDAAAEDRVRVGVVAAEQDEVGPLGVHRRDPLRDRRAPTRAGTPAWRSDMRPTRSPSGPRGQRGSSSAMAPHDEPARLDEAGVRGEPPAAAAARRPFTRGLDLVAPRHALARAGRPRRQRRGRDGERRRRRAGRGPRPARRPARR